MVSTTDDRIFHWDANTRSGGKIRFASIAPSGPNMPSRRSMGMPRKPTVQNPNTSNPNPAPNLINRPVRRSAVHVR